MNGSRRSFLRGALLSASFIASQKIGSQDISNVKADSKKDEEVYIGGNRTNQPPDLKSKYGTEHKW